MSYIVNWKQIPKAWSREAEAWISGDKSQSSLELKGDETTQAIPRLGIRGPILHHAPPEGEKLRFKSGQETANLASSN